MTIVSRKIYQYPSGEDLDLELVAQSLERQPGGPHISPRVSVYRWAKDRDLEIAFVDNCWIRVPLSREQVLEFLRANADPIQKPPPVGWEDEFTCDRYVLEEEEF